MDKDSISFVSVEEVLDLQAFLIERYGGLPGVRDHGLLTSAVMMPRQQFGGEYLHPDLAAMGAAYLYHLAKNHAFLDGNKRIALGAALTFLSANGVTQLPEQSEAADITIAVAAGEMSKEALTEWLRVRIGR
ncbi:MAG: type II toxin-antitoxin system death-on-curing family toxin [Phycisphaerales bacterium]|nr:type II toxin-antitoxin system death-on-curing family toxin [Phycisphaerales bacterium]